MDASTLDMRELKHTRDDFAKLSDAVIDWVKKMPESSKKTIKYNLYQTYCPMVKKNWIQSIESVRNPYAPYMLECGTIKSQLAKESKP